MKKKILGLVTCFAMLFSAGLPNPPASEIMQKWSALPMNLAYTSNASTVNAVSGFPLNKFTPSISLKHGTKISTEIYSPNETLNKFPSDTGVVPQKRGKDKRPAVLNQQQPSSQIVKSAAVPNAALVLYDKTGPYGWLGELYGIAAVNLASHFGAVSSKPVADYTTGELLNYKAVIYIGSTFDEPLPVAFLDDVLSNSGTQIIWINHNIWQLANRSTNFETAYGFNPWIFDFSSITTITYKNTDLTRDPLNGSGIMSYSKVDTTKTSVLATAKKADGTTIPWAIRGSNMTYIGEVPFAYISSNDRYLAFCDLLYDALNPTAATQHRALVRLEDVGPDTDPTEFRAIVDYLYSAGVPFSVALIPLYKDPLGYYNSGTNTTLQWKNRPQMQSAIKYAASRGGTIIMHGYTHQFSNVINPYSGTSGDDFEFFMTHIDASNNVIYDGAVPGDSSTWALNRISSGLSEIANAGFTTPTIFEYPHYAGTPTDSKAIVSKLATAYHRGLYFTGGLKINPENLGHCIGQFYPYQITDIYGWKTIPENLGNYEPEAYNNHPPRLASDLITTAQKNLVVRDGVASFFFHTYYPLSELKAIVEGVKASGYTFVAAGSM